MAIRQSITANAVPIIPFDLEWALRCCNNGLVYGEPNASVDALMAQAKHWDDKARDAIYAGNEQKHQLYSKHADRYLLAAAEVERYDGNKKQHRKARGARG